jgi:hypothetical protein
MTIETDLFCTVDAAIAILAKYAADGSGADTRESLHRLWRQAQTLERVAGAIVDTIGAELDDCPDVVSK